MLQHMKNNKVIAACSLSTLSIAMLGASDINRPETEKVYWDTVTKSGQCQRALVNERDELRLLSSADQWEQFERWHRWEDITRLAKPAIMPRVGYNSPVEHTLPIAPLACASTEIRKYIASRNDPNAFLHPEVAKYIAEHNLYL